MRLVFFFLMVFRKCSWKIIWNLKIIGIFRVCLVLFLYFPFSRFLLPMIVCCNINLTTTLQKIKMNYIKRNLSGTKWYNLDILPLSNLLTISIVHTTPSKATNLQKGLQHHSNIHLRTQPGHQSTHATHDTSHSCPSIMRRSWQWPPKTGQVEKTIPLTSDVRLTTNISCEYSPKLLWKHHRRTQPGHQSTHATPFASHLCPNILLRSWHPAQMTSNEDLTTSRGMK